MLMSGINDSPLFEEEDDYQHFRNVLTRVFDPRVSELGHVLHASFLASTHIHLLITVPAGDTIATSVKRLTAPQTQRIQLSLSGCSSRVSSGSLRAIIAWRFSSSASRSLSASVSFLLPIVTS